MGHRLCRMGSSPKHRTEAACQAERITEVTTVRSPFHSGSSAPQGVVDDTPILRIAGGGTDTLHQSGKGRVADHPEPRSPRNAARRVPRPEVAKLRHRAGQRTKPDVRFSRIRLFGWCFARGTVFGGHVDESVSVRRPWKRLV
jgi:hypothetical protein